MAGSTSDEGRPYFFQSAINDPHISCGEICYVQPAKFAIQFSHAAYDIIFSSFAYDKINPKLSLEQ